MKMEVGVKSDVFRQYFQYHVGGRSFVHDRHERSDTTTAWMSKKATHSTAFWITSVSARQGGDELYVAGVSRENEFVIERWLFRFAPGRHTALYGAPAPTIGSPQPRYSAVVQTNGTWSPLDDSVTLTPIRQEIYRGTEGPFFSLCPDPEGRFLTAYDFSSSEIVRILPQTPQWSISPLFSPAQHPMLARLGSIEERDFDGVRTYLINTRRPGQPRSQSDFAIMRDAQNDGIFEEFTTLPRPEFSASGYDDWSKWSSFWRID